MVVEVKNVALGGEVAAVYNKDVNSGNILVARWPNATVGLKVTSGATPAFSAWTQIVATAKITNPSWITAIFLENPTNAGAAETWLVDLAQGGAGVETSLANGTNTAQGIGAVSQAWLSSVGSWLIPPIYLPFPIRVTGSPRISAATAGLLVGGKDIFVSFQAASGVGT